MRRQTPKGIAATIVGRAVGHWRECGAEVRMVKDEAPRLTTGHYVIYLNDQIFSVEVDELHREEATGES